MKNCKYPVLNDRQWLNLHYWEKELSTTEIAKIVGCNPSAVTIALDRNNIPRRTQSEAKRKIFLRDGGKSRKYPLLNDKVWLRDKYEVEGLSTNAIAELVGVKTPNSVRQALIRANIVVRSVSDGLTHNREDDCFVLNMSVINGSLLGDAYLNVYNRTSDGSYPNFQKKNKYYDHVEYVAQALFTNNHEDKITKSGNWCRGKWHDYYLLRSLVHKELLPIYRKWYPESSGYIKVVPKDLEIDETVLLHWFLDDGSTSYRKRHYKNGWVQRKNQVVLSLCTEGFLREDQEFLCQKMENFGLPFRVRKYNQGTGWRISLSQSYVSDFYSIIGPPPVPSLAYKWKLAGVPIT